MEHDGSDYSWKLSDGSANYDPRACVAQRFYREHSDAYDFIVVFTNFEFETGEASAFYNLVRNDVRGIGLPLADNGWFFGSPGRLKGYIDMAALTRWMPPSGVFEPGDPAVSATLDVLAHEMAHQWLAQVRFRDGTGTLRSDLLGRDGSHWSYLLDSDASHMYGSDWADLGAGVYRAERVREAYSPLDLYLMGLLPAAKTPPFTLLRAPGADPSGLPREGAEQAATPETVTLSEVVAAEGPRAPSSEFAQKEFRLGFVLLVRPGSQPTTAEMLAVERLRDLFQAYFFVQTHGVAVADTTLAEAPIGAPLPTVDLDGAVAWLLAHQSMDGRWEDLPGSGVRDTSLALEALEQLGRKGSALDHGAAWVGASPAQNTDFVARRIVALAHAPLTAEQRASSRETLLRSRNPDGGFGPGPGYASTALDTALSLRALHALGEAGPLPARAIAALAAMESPGGGHGVTEGHGVSTVVSAAVVLSLLDWPDDTTAQALLSRSLLALLGRRNPDGGFGESPSTTYATAITLRALSRAGAPQGQLAPSIAWLKAAQREDRSFGGSRYETALALAALRSSLGGNLVVSAGSLAFDPPAAREGEQVRVTALVKNAGSAPVGVTWARIFDGAPDAGLLVGEVAVPALAPGAEAAIAFDFDTTDHAGARTLYVMVDGRNEVEEAREDDNGASLALRIEGLLADLQVAAVTVDPGPVTTGETAVVGITVRNLGQKRSPAGGVLRLVLGNPRQGGRVLGDAVMPAIDPGAVGLLTFDWSVAAVPGDYLVYAIADATYALVESDEGNNEGAVAVEVVGAPPSGAELSIPAFTAEPGVLTTIPQTVSLRVVLRNRGLAAASTRVAVLDHVSGQRFVDLPVSVGPRTSVSFVHPLTLEAAGTRQLDAVADPDDAIVEEDEGNNRATALILDRRDGIDLEVRAEDVATSAADLVVGETLTVVARVHNRGTAPVSNVPVVLARTGTGGGAELARQVIGLLAPGAVAPVTLSWRTAVVGSPLDLIVRVDPFGTFAELEETNNDVPLAVTVHASALPNLHVSGGDVSVAPDPPLERGNAAIRVRVTNPSVVAASANALAVYLGDPAAAGVLIGRQPVPELTPGGQATIEVPWPSASVDGVTGLFAVVDVDHQVAEFDETDNVAFRPVSLVGLPDLTLGMADVRLTPAFPHAGEAVRVAAIVRNLGAQPAAATVLRVFEGEAGGSLIAEQPVAPLPPGASVEVSVSWPASGIGERLLTVVVDPEGTVAEGDEGNNQARAQVLVQDADLYLSAPYFSPDGDGMRDETLLGWRSSGPVDIVISNRNGSRVRTLAAGAPAEGTLAWDGRDEEGVVLPDGEYTLNLRTPGGALLRRVGATIDTNRLAIHEAAGTGRLTTRNLTCTLPDLEGPAWMPSEDAALFVRSSSDSPEFPPGLLRIGVEGDSEYLFRDAWYAGAALPSAEAVSPDARTVLVQKDNELDSVDLSSGERQVLVSEPYYSPGQVRWSPDGRLVVVGQAVFRRDGQKLGDLPGYGRWAWSPDGAHLTLGFTVVDIDDLENPWHAPIGNGLVQSSIFTSTEWRSDGTVFTLAYDFGKNTCGDDCLLQCRNGCAVVYRPHTDEARQLAWLPPRTHSWSTVDWAPTADRVLYQRTSPTLSSDVTDVAAETGAQALQLMAHSGEVSSRKSLAYYWSSEAAQPDGACYGAGSSDLFAVRSLDNLSVDFQASRLPGNSGLLLVGVASDRNLDAWQLEYATTSSPETWHALTPASDAPVLDDVLTAWVPPAPGSYAIRLTGRDLAGNTRMRTRVVSWDRYPSIRNLTQSEFLISPNADGFKDAVRFDYFVVEPTHLEVKITGPQVSGLEAPGVVRRFALDYAEPRAESFVWDGRDEQGQVVPDGRYQALLNEVPLRVDVDNTPPDVAFAFVNLRSQRVVATVGEDATALPRGEVAAERAWHVVDANLKSWSSPSGEGTWPQYDPVRDAGGEVVYDERGRPEVRREGDHAADVVEAQPRVELVGALSGLGFSAVDRAGNRADIPVAAVPERLFVLGAEDPLAKRSLMSAPIDLQGTHGMTPRHTRFHVAETIADTPPEQEAARFQYRPAPGGVWRDGPSQALNGVGQSDVDFVGLGLDLKEAYQGRFVCTAANGHGDMTSEEFRFRPCERYMLLWSEFDDRAGLVRFHVTTAGVDQGVEATLTVKLGALLVFEGALERSAPGEFQSAWFKDQCYSKQARVLGVSGEWYPRRNEDPANAECIKLGGLSDDVSCHGGASVDGAQVRRPCAQSDPNRVFLGVDDIGASGKWITIEARPVHGPPYIVREYRAAPRLPGETNETEVDVTGQPHGEMSIRITATQDPGTSILAERLVTIFVDRVPPAGEVLQPAEGAVLCVSRDPDSGREAVAFTATAIDDAPGLEVSAEFQRDGGAFQPVSRLCPPGGCGDGLIQSGALAEIKWDVTPLPDGDYTARIRFCDRAGNRSYVDRRVTLNRRPPSIRAVDAVRPVFSPNGDGRADITSVTARLAQAADLSARVHSGPDASGPVVRTIFSSRALPRGDHGVSWDGRTDAGAVAPDGLYVIVLEALDPCGREGRITHNVEIDTTPPEVQITEPAAGSAVTSSVDVRGVAHDRNIVRHDLGASTDGLAPTTFLSGFSSIGSAGAPALLGRWVVPEGSGSATLHLEAVDKAENTAATSVQVVRHAAVHLGPLRAQPAVFSPNGDGRRETTTLEYTLLGSALVTLTVRDGAGNVVRRFIDGLSQETGPHALSWDGQRDTGGPAPDGAYTVEVTAAAPVGESVLESASAEVLVDRVAPAIVIDGPTSGAIVDRETAVVGSVQDLRLQSFVVTASTEGSSQVELARGSANQPTASRLASLSALADGPQSLTIDAEDQAENRTRMTTEFVLDAISPLVAIHSPTNGAVLLRSAAPIELTGAATDEHLQDWVMEFGRGSAPAFFGEIRRSPAGGYGIPVGPWAVAGLLDDTYALRLRASDRAQHVAESIVRVDLDGTPPVAGLTLPVEGQCLRAPVPMQGTATDRHLQDWQVDSAPGSASGAYQWTSVATGGEEVRDAPLATWAPLPPDGVHTLRLTVRDAVGLSTSVVRTVTVDTMPPGPPGDVKAEIRRNGGPLADVTLRWTAGPGAVAYRVHRDAEGLTDSANGTYTDVARGEGRYVYEVTALDACGNESEPARVTVKIDLTPPLLDILRPAENARVSGSVDVRGTAWSAGDFKEYRLLVGVGPDPQSWALLRRSALPVQGGSLGSWTALGQGTYTLRLEAEDTAGNSTRVLRHVVVDNDPPEAPVLISVERPDGTAEHRASLVTTWVPSAASDTIGYLVYRDGRLANATGIVIGDLVPYLVPPPSRLDAGLPDGEHCYHVSAMDGAWNLSPPSNELCKALDNRPPHAEIVQPSDGTRFQFPVRVTAFTPDTDVARVEFQYRPQGAPAWLSVGGPDTQAPWETTLDPQQLTFGAYDLQAVATDANGQVDPAPVSISVVYGDVTAPAAPADLRVRADERRVSLAWTAGTESDVAGYNVYREGLRLTETPVTSPLYEEEREPGRYSYTVTAVDGDGNESGPSNAAIADVYRLALDEVFPVTLATSAALSGGGAHAETTIDARRAGSVAASAVAVGDRFTVAAVPLVPGGNVFVAQGRDARGDRSVASNETVLIANSAPAALDGLTADVHGHEVALAWQASAEPDLFGYAVRRGAAVLTPSTPQTEDSSIVATSSIASYYGPRQAFDGLSYTAWMPSPYGASDQSWSVQFPATVLVERVEIDFVDGFLSPAPPPRYRLEALWEGRYVPLAQVSQGTASMQHTFAWPFATEGLRVVVGVDEAYHGIAELRVFKQDLAPAGSTTFVEAAAPDGRHVYQIAAVDRYGAYSPWVSVEAPVGDADPPAPPAALACVPDGSDAVLSWSANSEPDLDHYAVVRGPSLLATTGVAAFRDAGLANGTYTYAVKAVDRAGNESSPSDTASCTIAVSPPVAPVLRAAVAPSASILLTWEHPGAGDYIVSRSLVSGGPYAEIGRATERQLLDTSTAYGVRHFYVVTAADAQGRLSAASNEAAAVPARTDPPAAPVVLFPADAAHPATVEAFQTPVAGRTDPSTRVSLRVDGAAQGEVEAHPAFTPQFSASVPPSAALGKLSPDGRYLAYWSEGLRWMDLASGTEGRHDDAGLSSIRVLGFAPDGRRLLYSASTHGPDEGSDLFWVDVRDGTGQAIETGDEVIQDASWSPDGRYVAFAATAADLTDGRVKLYELGTGVIRTLFTDGGWVGGISWSPDGSRIAFSRGSDWWIRDIVVQAIADDAPLALGLAGLLDAQWLADGSGLVFTDVSLGNARVRRYDLATGTASDLTEWAPDQHEPRVDPSGRWVSFTESFYDDTAQVSRTLVVAHDLQAGVSRALADDRANEQPSVVGWTRSGHLGLVRVDAHGGARIELLPGFDSGFGFGSVRLHPGRNTLTAQATDTASGLVSPPSTAVLIDAPLAIFPDLEVTSGDLGSYPAVPQAGQEALATVRVRNVGGGAAKDIGVRLVVSDPAGVVLAEGRPVISLMAPGQSATVSVDWRPAAVGQYSLQAVVDEADAVGEAREDNNRATRPLPVSGAGLVLSLDSDQASYAAGASALVTAHITNGGVPFAGTARLSVVDAQGHEVSLLSERAVSLVYGATFAFDARWSTGTSYAGAYSFELRLADANGAPSGTASRSFIILPDVRLGAGLRAGAATIAEGTSARFHATVTNLGANAPLGSLLARFVVVAQGAIVPLFESPVTALPTLPPQAAWDHEFIWPIARPAGRYRAELRVGRAEGPPMAVVSAPFDITASAIIVGTLEATPADVVVGESFEARFSVTSLSAGALNDYPVVVEAVSGPQAVVAAGQSTNVSLQPGQTVPGAFTFSTSSLRPGTYTLRLRAGEPGVTLARSNVRVHGLVSPPSIHAPQDSAVVDDAHPLLIVNDATTTSEGAPLSYEFELYGNPSLGLALPGQSGVAETPLRTSWRVTSSLAEDNVYYWRARASDGFSQSAWSAVASFRLDAVNLPPQAPLPDSPEPGASVISRQPTLVVANAMDPENDSLTYDFELGTDPTMATVIAAAAGIGEGRGLTPWVPPVLLDEHVTYWWRARASDGHAQSPWCTPVSLVVDLANDPPTAPVPARPLAAERVPTLTPRLVVGNAQDPEHDTLSYRFEIDTVASFNSPDLQAQTLVREGLGETDWVAPGPLRDNTHYFWRALASDGRLSGPWANANFLVDLANEPPGPPLPLDPVDGRAVTTPTPNLLVRNAVDPENDPLTHEFEVYDSTGALVATAAGIGSGAAESSWIVAPPLLEDHVYTWRARAQDNELAGAWSAPVAFRVNAVIAPPTAPTRLAPPECATVGVRRPELVVANAASADGLALSYAFELYGVGSGGVLTLVAQANGLAEGPSSTRWQSGVDLADGRYSWRARATDTVPQPGAWMDSACFYVVVDVPPAAPVHLVAAPGDARVTLDWTPSPESDVTRYTLYRSLSAGGPFNALVDSTVPHVVDTAVTNGTTYHYVVTAHDGVFESARSNEAAATPQGSGVLLAELRFAPATIQGECILSHGCCDASYARALLRGSPAEEGQVDETMNGGSSPTLTPLLECVADNLDGTYSAYFGSDNTGSAVTLPVGSQNYFNPAPQNRGQPTTFASGRTAFPAGAFEVVFDGRSLSWKLKAKSVTASSHTSACSAVVPTLDCPQWVKATIELPGGLDPRSISLSSLRLAGAVRADGSYSRLVDSDGDGRRELEVRFAFHDLDQLLTMGSHDVTLVGKAGGVDFRGAGAITVDAPRANLWLTPRTLQRSVPGAWVEAQLRVSDCLDARDIDTSSLRLNESIRMDRVVTRSRDELVVRFKRSSVAAVLPNGGHVEVRLSGRFSGQTFVSRDYIRVTP